MAARNTFFRLIKPLWTFRKITIKMDAHVYAAVVVYSILLYGCDTWPLKVEVIKKLSILDRSCLRHGLLVHQADKIKHYFIHSCSNTTYINSTIAERHSLVLRRPPQELTCISLFAKLCEGWHQKRGRPVKTWTETGKILNVKMVQRYMDLDGMAYITGMQKEWLILLPVIPNSLETPYPCSKPNQWWWEVLREADNGELLLLLIARTITG